MRKILSSIFFFLFCSTSLIHAQDVFGQPQQQTTDTFMYVGVFAIALIIAVIYLFFFGDNVKHQITHLVDENENVYLNRKERIRAEKERRKAEKEAARAEINQKKAEELEKLKAELTKINAEKAAKQAIEDAKAAKKAAKKALDALTEEEMSISADLTDDLITKSIKGKHMIERLRRDVGMPVHTDDSELVSAGRVYDYNGKHVYVQLTDVNIDKLNSRIWGEMQAAKLKKQMQEAQVRSRRRFVRTVWFLVILGILLFFTFADKM